MSDTQTTYGGHARDLIRLYNHHEHQIECAQKSLPEVDELADHDNTNPSTIMTHARNQCAKYHAQIAINQQILADLRPQLAAEGIEFDGDKPPRFFARYGR
jgi:hypothetical protein